MLVYYWNSDQTTPEKSLGDDCELRLRIDKLKPHVIFVADAIKTKGATGIGGYIMTRLRKHKEGRSGGILAYVRKDIDKDVKAKLFPEERLIGIEFVRSRLTVYATYLPPTEEAQSRGRDLRTGQGRSRARVKQRT